MGRKITALKVQKKNSGRVNVYLEGEFAFGLARIVAAWLQVGQELSEERIAALQAEDAFEATYQRVLQFINYRDRTAQEIRQYLARRNIPPDLVDRVLDRLAQSGLVSDRRFANQWVDNRNTFRPRSRRALQYELKQKGISQDIIDTALDQFDDDAAAHLAARRRAPKFKHLDWPEFRQKMYAFLARRGFSYATAGPIVERVWNELNEAELSEEEQT